MASLWDRLWGAAVLHADASPQQTVWLSTCSCVEGGWRMQVKEEGVATVAFCKVMGEGASL